MRERASITRGHEPIIITKGRALATAVVAASLVVAGCSNNGSPNVAANARGIEACSTDLGSATASDHKTLTLKGERRLRRRTAEDAQALLKRTLANSGTITISAEHGTVLTAHEAVPDHKAKEQHAQDHETAKPATLIVDYNTVAPDPGGFSETVRFSGSQENPHASIGLGAIACIETTGDNRVVVTATQFAHVIPQLAADTREFAS